MLNNVTIDRKDHHVDRSIYNGVLVTSDDLSSPRLSVDSGGISSIYVKPLDVISGSVSSSFHSQKRNPSDMQGYQISKDTNTSRKHSKSENAFNPNVTRTLQIDFRRRLTGSPSANRISRSSFTRHTAVRRSLGGIAAPPAWLVDTSENVGSGIPGLAYPIQLCQTKAAELSSGCSFGPNLRVRTSRLPSLDDLGFTLDPCVHPQTGEFIGLRLQDRLWHRYSRPEARNDFPFLPNDIVVAVNQHKLANMHESQAIRYACNAFRDARQYTVEFGIYRPTENLDSGQLRAPEFSSLPARKINRNRFSEIYLSDSPSPNDAVVNPHRPLRSVLSSPSSSHPLRCTDLRSSRSDVSKFTPPEGVSTRSPKSESAGSPISRLNSMLNPITNSALTPPSMVDSGFQRPEIVVNSPRTNSLLVERRHSLTTNPSKNLNAFNTRAIGHKISIDLIKSNDGGLGFTLTSRDTHISVSSNEPVYVKTILSTGAAISDGRLMVGDRLLSVDGKEVENLEQVLAQLRRIRPGMSVNLVVSRHGPNTFDDVKERKSTGTGSSISPERPSLPYRSLTFEYPLIAASHGPSSLGVNFKWQLRPFESDRTFADCPGLYVESLIPGGLISTTGGETLLPGDRLVGVNGESLEGLNAKSISSRIKSVLLGKDSVSSCDPSETNSRHRNFSLTVHRYSVLNEQQFGNSSYRNVYPVDGSQSEVRYASQSHITTPTALKYRRHSVRHASFDKWSDNWRPQNDVNMEILADETNSSPRYSSVPPRLLAVSSFDREGLGRRSVSEKRHGHLNPAQYSFFRTNVLPNRCKMPEDVDKQYSTMPTARRLKLHKDRMSAISSSGPLRAFDISANQPVEDKNTESDGGRSVRDNPKNRGFFRRGRKQNSSFRNAVDRSLILQNASTSNGESGRLFVVNPEASADQSLIANEVQVINRRSLLTDSCDISTPPLPPRQQPASSVHTQSSPKPSKRSFSSFRGLFKRSDKKCAHTSASETSCQKQSKVQNHHPPVHDNGSLHTSINSLESRYRSRHFSEVPESPHIPTYRTFDVSAPDALERSQISNGKVLKSIKDPPPTFTSSGKNNRERKRVTDDSASSPPPPPLPPRPHQPKSSSVPYENSSFNATVSHTHTTHPTDVRSPKPHKSSSRTRSPVYVPKPLIKRSMNHQSTSRRSSADFGHPVMISRHSDRYEYSRGHSHCEAKRRSVHELLKANASAKIDQPKQKSREHQQLYTRSSKQASAPPSNSSLSFKPERSNGILSRSAASSSEFKYPMLSTDLGNHSQDRTTTAAYFLQQKHISNSTRAPYSMKIPTNIAPSRNETDLQKHPTKTKMARTRP